MDIDLISPDITPSSLAQVGRETIRKDGMWWKLVFCASCGKENGITPESTTFIFWLCAPCFKKYGDKTMFLFMPDEVFWQKIKHEQLEKYGRLLTIEELNAVVAADASPLATLIKEGR